MSDRLVWEQDGRDWPNREASRFVEAGGLRWHVQTLGEGPVALLLHGTGASTHSWRGLAPLLAREFMVVAPDLPGHAFTATPPSAGLSLPGMAKAVGELARALEIKPAVAIGHSAGAAVLLRMCLDRLIAPHAVVSLNGALLPFGGIAAPIFSPLAKLLFLNPVAPRLFARRAADPRAVSRVIEGTGSVIDAKGLALYARLFQSPAHCAAALGMMANWDLAPLVRDLPRLETRLLLVAGSADRAVSADAAFRVQGLAPGAKVEVLRGLGHLAHEEKPEMAANLVTRFATAQSLQPL